MSDPGPAQISSANLLTLPDGRMSPSSSRTMKDYATQISDLKKENFSLKLRIFYMEERMQQQFDEDYEQVSKTNIELKVECDSLRKELQDKHDLLIKASNAVACMEGGPEEVRKAQELAQRELQQVKDAMHERVQEADKELRAVRSEADSLAENVQKLQDYAHKLEQDNEKLKTDLDLAKVQVETMSDLLPDQDKQKDEGLLPEQIDILKEDLQKKDKLIDQLRETLEVKQTMVEALSDEKKLEEETLENSKEIIISLEEKNKELECELAKRKQQEDRLRSEYTNFIEMEHEYQQHISEQQQRLDEFEIAARQMSEELEKREDEVKDLTDALKDAEDTGKELADNYDRLKNEKEDKKTKELLMRDKAISGLTEVIRKKDEELARLKEDAAHRETHLEELTNTITKLNSQEDDMGRRMSRIRDLERQVEELKQRIAELEKKNKKLTVQLENSEELVLSMDSQLKEKDEELQELLTKYKDLLKKQQQDELEKLKALRDQENMAEQFEKEKREFGEIVNNMKRQFEESAKDAEEREKEAEILRLQEQLQTVQSHLRVKHLQLEEATNLFKKAECERKATLGELEAAMKRRDEEQRREVESRNRINAAKSAEIDRLREEIRVKDDRIQNLEDNLLQLDRAAHEARDKAVAAAREAARWKDDSARKDSVIEELKQSLEALGNAVPNSEQKQIIRLTRENVELKQLLKAREAELAFLQNEQAADDPYIESLQREIARKDKIIADERSKISEDTSSMNLALDTLRLELENHKRELNNAKHMITTLTSELEASHQQATALRKACDAKDRVIEDLKMAQRYPIIESEEGSSTATENMRHTSHRHQPRQQKFTKRRSKHRMHDDNASIQSSSTNSVLKLLSDDGDFDMLSSENDITASHPGPRIKEELKNEIQDLHRELEAIKAVHRDGSNAEELLQKLESQREHLRRLTDILTQEQKLYRKHLNVPRTSSHSESDNGSELAKSKRRLDRALKQVEDLRNKLRTLLLEVSHTEDASIQVDGFMRQSVSSTVFPLNQTSYMDIPIHDVSSHTINEEKDATIHELQAELEKTKLDLGNAVGDLRSALSEITQLKDQLEDKQKEIQRLKKYLEDMKKGEEVKEAEMSDLRIEVDKLRSLQLKLAPKDSDTDQQRSIYSGDESDGMGALSRRELRESIGNLKKKLKNAEKLNNLLGDQIESARQEKPETSVSFDPHLATKLSSEIERLKEQLRDTQEQLTIAEHQMRKTPEQNSVMQAESKASRAPSRSRLPVPVEKLPLKVKESPPKEKQDYASLKVQNTQLQNKLSATEETVRQQTEKLKRCKAAMAAAGITDVPLSPIRSARSHPDLLFGNLPPPNRNNTLQDTAHHSRGASMDTAEVRTQTSADDTGYASVSPKSEEKYNSLIQAQAKELSTLRQQLKKARETCKDLRTEYDIVLRYITTLLNTSEGQADTMLATSVTNELERCKQLTRRLKEQLSEWTSDGSLSSDSDDSVQSRKMSIAQQQANQLLRKSQEIDEKNQKIQDLENKIANLMDLTRESEPHFKAVKGQKIVPENLGYLTPTSSHHSIYTNTEEEAASPSFRPIMSQNTEYAALPGRRSSRLDKSLPMYQRTIAVTEYLPGNDDLHEENVGIPGRRRLPTTSDAENCTASYGGSWRSTASPRKPHESSSMGFHPGYQVHSSPVGRDDNVGALKRKLEDSKRLNESLKEELVLTNEALSQARRRSSHGQIGRNPADVLEEHLNEIRSLRLHLETSIATNDRLREQLEKKLKQAGGRIGGADHVSANIYLPAEAANDQKYETEIDGLRHELTRANDEIAKLKTQLKAEISMKNNFAAASRELEQLRMRLVESSTQTEMLGNYIDDLNQSITEKNVEVEDLQIQVERLEEEVKQLNDEKEVNKLETETLRENADEAAECAGRMREDLNRLNDELDESHHLVRSLKSELAIYEKIHKSKAASDGRSPARGQGSNGWNVDISEFLSEIKSLRVQLERSIEANGALRKQLQEQLRYNKENTSVLSPGRTTTINIHHLPPNSPGRNEDEVLNGRVPESGRSSGTRRKLKMTNDEKPSSFLMTPPPSASSCGDENSISGFEFAPLPTHGPLTSSGSKQHPNGKRQSWPYYDLHGPFVLGKLSDYNELKQVVTDGRLLVRNMELRSAGKTVQSSLSPSRTPSKNKLTKDLESNLRLLQKMLEDSGRILKLFWPASVPAPELHIPLSRDSEQVCQKCTSRQSDASSDISKCTKDAGFASDSSINSEADGLRREVSKLHKRLSAQDKLLQSTVDRLQTANRLKEGIEHAILRQLTVTHDVLKKARGNLEAKAVDTHPKERHVPSS